MSPTPSTLLAGSYYVESLTDRLEKAAFDYIAEIDRQGGAVEALESGYQTDEIHESAFKLQREIEEDDRIVVGVNKFTTETPPIQQFQRIDPEAVQKQIARVQRVRHERDEAVTAAALQRLRAIAVGIDNTVPAILECVESYATVGEIADVFRSVFGEQR